MIILIITIKDNVDNRWKKIEEDYRNLSIKTHKDARNKIIILQLQHKYTYRHTPLTTVADTRNSTILLHNPTPIPKSLWLGDPTIHIPHVNSSTGITAQPMLTQDNDVWVIKNLYGEFVLW